MLLANTEERLDFRAPPDNPQSNQVGQDYRLQPIFKSALPS